MWRHGSPCTLLAGRQSGTANLESSLVVRQCIKHRLTTESSNSTPDTDPREMKIHVHTKPCTQLFITGLFTLAKKKEATQMSIDC